MKKKISIITIVSLLIATLCVGCSGEKEVSKKESITIAYQSSVGYAPLLVMKEKKMIENSYDGDIEINWVEMKNGSEINEGLVAGTIDVGTMGVPVAISGIIAGSPYKIAFGMSCQPYSIITSDESILKLSDITDQDQIAITNINSQPHILLAMAAQHELGDAHALDKNLTVLSNSDGYSAMISGAVSCHMVISPYNFMELENTEKEMHEIVIDDSIWPKENTTLVGVVTNDLKENHCEVYDALTIALNESMEFIKQNPEETAKIISSGYDADEEEILKWITDDRSSYSTEVHGIMSMVDFMNKEGFIKDNISSIEELVYESVKGD